MLIVYLGRRVALTRILAAVPRPAAPSAALGATDA